MKRLVDADVLAGAMYRAAFIDDSDMQKWDSGCWIRYKLFEKVLEEQLERSCYLYMDDKHCPFCGAELKEGADK